MSREGTSGVSFIDQVKEVTPGMNKERPVEIHCSEACGEACNRYITARVVSNKVWGTSIAGTPQRNKTRINLVPTPKLAHKAFNSLLERSGATSGGFPTGCIIFYFRISSSFYPKPAMKQHPGPLPMPKHGIHIPRSSLP